MIFSKLMKSGTRGCGTSSYLEVPHLRILWVDGSVSGVDGLRITLSEKWHIHGDVCSLTASGRAGVAAYIRASRRGSSCEIWNSTY